MNRYGIMGLLLWVFFPLVASAQIPDSIAGPLTALARRVEQFGEALPQEKVALHLDNTSYFIRATTSGSSATWWPPD